MTGPLITHGFVRTVSPSLAGCELLHLPRQAIDLGLARQQHSAYVEALRTAGVTVNVLPEEPELPDATFVEDTAIVLDEVAVICRPGVASRQPEAERMERELASVRPIRRIETPGTLEGGDVLRLGRSLFVGLSSRTNEEGLRQLQAFVSPLGYRLKSVYVRKCLHLKTAVTSLGDGRLLANARWIDPGAFPGLDILEVPESEPWGANILAVNGTVFVADRAPRTASLLEAKGLMIHRLCISELQKAEAGLTCLSILFRAVPTC